MSAALSTPCQGCTPSQFSPIFGIIHLATVLTSPFMAKVITRLGLRAVFRTSLVLIFAAAVCCGCLTYVQDTATFLVLAYLLRILAGVGGAALWTAMLSLLLASFPNNSGMVYSMVDATFGLGFTLGPVLGSVLYVYGGFLTPFLVTGVMLAVSGLLCLWTCRGLMDFAETQITDTRLRDMLPILRSFEAVVALASACSASLTVGYVTSLLEMHLETFSLSVASIGLCFFIMSISFSVVTFVSGYCADKILYPGTITVLGFLLLVVTFTFLGPAPYLPLPPSLELTLPSLVTQGAGSAAVIVSTYSSCLRATLNIPGYPRNATTNTVVSGLWTSVFALGNFVGPTLAGVMYEEIGFQWGTLVVQIVLVLILMINIFARLRIKHNTVMNTHQKFC